MRFSPSRFNRHLANIGQRVAWRRSYACACLNLQTGNPDPKHALCGGKGRLWVEPVETVIGVTRQEVKPEMIAAGIYESGDMTATVPAASPMWAGAGQFDRILLLNSTDVFSQPYTRGAPNERLLFTPASIDRCFWLHRTTREIVEGGVPVCDATGNLSWPNGGEPPPGTTYSLTGQRFDEYYILDSLPSDRNEHSGYPLPKRLQLRKFDLFNR